jgi:hypothetical protein
MTLSGYFEMLIDNLPIRWAFVFHVSVIFAVVLTLWQVKSADIVNEMRWNGTSKWLLNARRITILLKAAALVWTVEYSYANNWMPWPPIVAFIIAFDIYVGLDIFLMHRDAVRLKQRQSSVSRTPVHQ